jgi:hypothetical protein
MASEIPTRMLNQEKSIFLDLKFSNDILRALVICGLFNIIKIFTGEIDITLLNILVSNNSELMLQFLNFLHIVCCVNRINPIKEPF